MTDVLMGRKSGGDVFVGSSEMAEMCRQLDWAATSLGPVEHWPEALRSIVRTILESPFPFNLWCGADRLLIYNDGYRRVLGAKHPRALGKPGREVWREIWPEIEPMFESVRQGRPVYAEDAPFVVERADGPPGEAWFTFSLSAVRSDDGEIVAYLNVASETTKSVETRREVERALAAAERAEHQLREVFAQAPAFLAVLRGKQHVFEFVNAAYLQLVGHRDLLGKPVVEALPEVTTQGFVTLLDEVLESGVPFVGRELPVMLQREKGGDLAQVYVNFVYQPITDPEGKRIGIVAHGSDVTESVLARREVERLWFESESARKAAQESEARYRFMTNAIPVQIWTATPDGALDYISEPAARYFGKTASEVIGDQWLSVLHPDDVDRTMDRWRRSLESGEAYEVEFRLWSAEHQGYRWHLGRATPQRDETGHLVRWFGTNTEIEERKQAEVELQRLTAEATEADRAKAAFLAAMSHELRTPLNAIGGYAQLMEMGVRGPITEEQRIDLLKIQRSKNHLDALVSDVLNFAKLGSGKMEYHLANVDVHNAIQSVLEMVGPQIAAKQLRIAPYSTPRQLTVLADADKVRQILINLFGNALKFTPPGGVISLDVKPGEYEVAISVTDTGIGIPEEDQARIFEPFTQSGHALDSRDQGVGLGLAISRQFARAMRGDLRVVSTVGSGSTFTLTLPRR
ncbi:MAG TPA: PAS domain-containing protein [Gemmatimonadaceae bacterium]|nr:PAS domain-containing protein [Gemmatimonadaceae bacterium]